MNGAHKFFIRLSKCMILKNSKQLNRDEFYEMFSKTLLISYDNALGSARVFAKSVEIDAK